MSENKTVEIFPRTPSKTYGLMELVKKTSPLTEKEPENTEFTWPYLVYIEFLMAIAVTIVLLVLSLFWDAPLEELATPDTTPNPMKAPWYFLGLQELLVYFDPWIAGVVLPTFIIIGLMLIPYIDVNQKGTGTYNFRDRKFAVTNFIFGLFLWDILIVIGVWLRGLDWNWYWPWEDWSRHKPLTGGLEDFPVILERSLGISGSIANLISYLVVLGYFFVGFGIPFVFSRKFYKRLGFVRFTIVMTLFLLMMGVPLKIFVRLLFSIKYVMITPWFKI